MPTLHRQCTWYLFSRHLEHHNMYRIKMPSDKLYMNEPSLFTTLKRARHDFVILTVNNAGKGKNTTWLYLSDRGPVETGGSRMGMKRLEPTNRCLSLARVTWPTTRGQMK